MCVSEMFNVLHSYTANTPLLDKHSNNILASHFNEYGINPFHCLYLCSFNLTMDWRQWLQTGWTKQNQDHDSKINIITGNNIQQHILMLQQSRYISFISIQVFYYTAQLHSTMPNYRQPATHKTAYCSARHYQRCSTNM